MRSCSSADSTYSSTKTIYYKNYITGVTGASRCGNGTVSVSATGNNGATITWYDAATGGAQLGTGSPFTATVSNNVSVNQYTNNFSSNTGTGTLSGNAALSGGAVSLTPNLTSQAGGLTIPASGVNGLGYSVDFKLTTGAAQSAADGMSYSFGDDVSATDATLNAEFGTGSKLKISFDIYGTSGNDVSGIRLIYGTTTNTPGQTSGTNNVLGYSSGTTWSGVSNVPVNISITSDGKLTLTVNGSAIFSGVQLPAGFLAADKSTWQYVFRARSGGVAGAFSVDDVTLSYQTPNTNAGYQVLWATAANGTCEGVRVADTVYMSVAPALTLSTNSVSICAGTPSAPVTVTAGSANYDVLNWTPSTGVSGDAVNGYTFNPSATTSFTLNGSQSAGTCLASATVNVTVNPVPFVSTATASPTTVCAGAPVTLTATSVAASTGNATVGSNNTTQSGSGLSPFAQFYEGQHTQFLYKASDIAASGLQAGAITKIGFNVTSAVSTLVFSNYTVKMAQTSATDLAAGLISPTFTTVYGPTTLAAVTTTGWLNLNLAPNFTWDGTSNIVVDVCFSNDPGGTQTLYSANSIVQATTKSYTAVYGYYADNSALCGTTGGSSITSTALPDIRFRGSVGTNYTSTFNYTWNPGGVTGSTATVNPQSTTTYVVSVTDPASGCVGTSTLSASVTVNPLPAAPETSGSTQCGNGVPSCFAVGTTNGNYQIGRAHV